jgi:hypothetical protein
VQSLVIAIQLIIALGIFNVWLAFGLRCFFLHWHLFETTGHSNLPSA